jgi:hypothetical protein
MGRAAGLLAGIALLGAVLVVAFPDRYLGYDAAWALVWGREVVDGISPAFEAPFAPTPHPLLNAVAIVLVGVLGAGTAGSVLAWAGVAGLAAAAWLGYLLGRTLFGPAAGVVLAGLLLTRPFLVLELGYASHDLPFLALVLGAGLALATRPMRPRAALALLALAGLLRPEAWALAGLAAVWLWRRAPPGTRRTLVMLAAAAPLLWLLQDALVTGDPLHSLHGTRDLASDVGRPTGSAALPALPEGLGVVLEPLVAWTGAVALGLLLWLHPRRLALVAAAAAAAAATFLALGGLGLPVLPRYLLVPAVALALAAAAVATGAADTRGPRLLLLLAGACAAAIVVSVPASVSELRGVRGAGANRAALQDDLRTLSEHPAVRAVARRCDVATVPTAQVRPHVALWLGLEPERIARRVTGAGPGVVLVLEDPAALDVLSPVSAAVGAAVTTPPPGAVRLGEAGGWVAYARC